MLRKDLDAAGIPYRDELGQVFDFHAAGRVQFITGLSRACVHPKKAQSLARHSDINLTINVYTRLKLTELQDAVESLPPPGPARGLRWGGA